jgi:hypothetical protein
MLISQETDYKGVFLINKLISDSQIARRWMMSRMCVEGRGVAVDTYIDNQKPGLHFPCRSGH